jgi:hypothetical protein
VTDKRVPKTATSLPKDETRKNPKSYRSNLNGSKSDFNGSINGEPPELMRFADCARDGSVCVKTITRWVKAGLLTEWRPRPESRTRRIKRHVWIAFKQRFKK